jgi:hypothetical protein
MSRSRAGHRGAYEDFVRGLFEGRVSHSGLNIGYTHTIFYLMIEEWCGRYIFDSVARAILGRRTVGLMFRPSQAVYSHSVRLTLKRVVFKILRRLSAVRTLAIVPVELDLRLGEIVDGWIYDFQLWDLGESHHEMVAQLRSGNIVADQEANAFYQRIKSRAAGRPVLIALGAQNSDKGFARLAKSIEQIVQSGWFVVVAGRVDPKLAPDKCKLLASDALVEDRVISDAELLAAYAGADAVWCVYDPGYDQASGILGRAVQLGCPVLVRSGSLSEAFCLHEKLPHLAVSYTESGRLDMCVLADPSPMGGQAAASRFREHSLAVLSSALCSESISSLKI